MVPPAVNSKVSAVDVPTLTPSASFTNALPPVLTNKLVALVLTLLLTLPMFPEPELRLTVLPVATPEPVMLPVPFAVNVRFVAAPVAVAFEPRLMLPLVPTPAIKLKVPA